MPWQYDINDLYVLCANCHHDVTKLKAEIDDLIWRGSMDRQFATARFIADILQGRHDKWIAENTGRIHE